MGAWALPCIADSTRWDWTLGRLPSLAFLPCESAMVESKKSKEAAQPGALVHGTALGEDLRGAYDACRHEVVAIAKPSEIAVTSRRTVAGVAAPRGTFLPFMADKRQST